MRLTSKQKSIIKVIKRGNRDGSFYDLDQILQRLDYETTKASFQFSVRALVKKGLIQKTEREKRRGYQRCVISLTENGYQTADSWGL